MRVSYFAHLNYIESLFSGTTNSINNKFVEVFILFSSFLKTVLDKILIEGSDSPDRNNFYF